MTTLLKIENVSKIFKSGAAEIHALASASLEIRTGEFVALIGPSGSGKTTLLNLIGCLDHPTRGDILLNGQNISKLSQTELSRERLYKIGFIFQDYNLIPTLSVLENVEYALWLQGVDKVSRRERAKEVLIKVGLEKMLNRRPNALSRGQQQRVAVSRAIVHKPVMVLGDELTANLDHKTGALLMDFLKELNEKEGMTFIYATHDPVMMQKAKRIIELQDGKILRDGKN